MNSNNDDSRYEEITQNINRNGNAILERSKKSIIKPTPILTIRGTPLIFLNTINVIEGQQGTHKSRLAETICGALLSQHNTEGSFFNKVSSDQITVAYVETERNYNEQSPKGIQHIKKCLNVKYSEELPNFFIWPLIEESREVRKNAIVRLIKGFHDKNPKRSLFVVIDLITDCMRNFNDIDESNELIDMMLKQNNIGETTFLAIIHQNPTGGASDPKKARGHIGTELVNKSSLAIELRNNKKHPNEVKFDLIVKKNRNAKLGPKFTFSVNEQTEMLELEDEWITSAKVAPIELLQVSLYDLFTKDLRMTVSTQTIEQHICEALQKKVSTAKNLLKQFLDEEHLIFNTDHDKKYRLQKIKLSGGNKCGYMLIEEK
jgi:hypothetical protein